MHTTLSTGGLWITKNAPTPAQARVGACHSPELSETRSVVACDWGSPGVTVLARRYRPTARRPVSTVMTISQVYMPSA